MKLVSPVAGADIRGGGTYIGSRSAGLYRDQDSDDDVAVPWPNCGPVVLVDILYVLISAAAMGGVWGVSRIAGAAVTTAGRDGLAGW